MVMARMTSPAILADFASSGYFASTNVFIFGALVSVGPWFLLRARLRETSPRYCSLAPWRRLTAWHRSSLPSAQPYLETGLPPPLLGWGTTTTQRPQRTRILLSCAKACQSSLVRPSISSLLSAPRSKGSSSSMVIGYVSHTNQNE